jgi:uncharacterized protein (DUF2235 family)
VVKIAEVVSPVADDGVVQLMYYDSGVGTSGSWLGRVIDGATGRGLSRNILEAYRYLIANYQPEDQLVFFGFSRGAFTVRSLVGLIRKCGILRMDAAHMVDRAYELYRARSAAAHPGEREAPLFRRTSAGSDITPVKFMGVWDTVGALGNPLLANGILSRRYKFHDTDLSSTVEHAYQALAIDERRRFFQATMWRQQAHAINTQTLEQVWFVGVHCNVGGGYSATGLSDIALEWILSRARPCGITLDAISTQCSVFEPRQESRKGFYRLIPEFHRPIAKPDPEKGPTNEALHPSVIQRYQKDPAYRPKNLEDYFKRFPHLRPPQD